MTYETKFYIMGKFRRNFNYLTHVDISSIFIGEEKRKLNF